MVKSTSVAHSSCFTQTKSGLPRRIYSYINLRCGWPNLITETTRGTHDHKANQKVENETAINAASGK